MTKTYRYRLGRHTMRFTLLYFLVFAGAAAGLYLLYEGGFLSAWFVSFVAALIALMSLSVPRRIVVDRRGLHIYCLLELTELPRKEIASARTVEPAELKGLIPIFGGYGFFGYYGHYFDLKNLERVRIYASEWRNFVEITDIYEKRIYVSCSEPEELVADLQKIVPNEKNHRSDREIPA